MALALLMDPKELPMVLARGGRCLSSGRRDGGGAVKPPAGGAAKDGGGLLKFGSATLPPVNPPALVPFVWRVPYPPDLSEVEPKPDPPFDP